jgi:hypothetical protein
MSFGVTVYPRSDGEAPGPLTRPDLKRLAGEADLALAEAKGKSRPDLKPRGAADAPIEKNRVRGFVGQAFGEVGKGGEAPGPGRFYREKRKYERSNVSTPFLYREEGGFRVAKTVNISLEGARIVSDSPLPADRAVETILVIEDKATAIRSDIVYSEKGGGEPGFYYSGVKFLDLTFEGTRGLEDYLVHFRRGDGLA